MTRSQEICNEYYGSHENWCSENCSYKCADKCPEVQKIIKNESIKKG